MFKRVLIIGSVIGVIGLTGAWLLGWFSSNKALAEVQQMQTKLADPNLKDDERRAITEQMRAKMTSLSPDARRTAFEGMRTAFERRNEQHIDQILAMSPAERNKAIDADIDRMEKMRAQAEANAKSAASAQANGQNDSKKGPPGQGRRGGNPSDDQRVDRLRNRLDRSSPEMRAKRNAYMQLVNARRQQRGLPPMTGRGRG
jgi:hypothetical protein